MHAPPAGRQHRFVIGDGAQVRPSAQQLGAAPPGTHESDSAMEHTGARHVPDWHVSPVQHCELVVHALLDGRQHLPLWQRSAPQHPRLDAQVPPVAWQHRFVVGAPAHVYPLTQHPGAAAPGVHVVDSVSEHTGVRQVPDWHVRPVQHSLLVAHAAPDGSQQRPLWQSPAPQHPSEPVHAPPAARQQRFVVGAPAQERPSAQQSGAAVPGAHVAASVSEHTAAAHMPD